MLASLKQQNNRRDKLIAQAGAWGALGGSSQTVIEAEHVFLDTKGTFGCANVPIATSLRV